MIIENINYIPLDYQIDGFISQSKTTTGIRDSLACLYIIFSSNKKIVQILYFTNVGECKNCLSFDDVAGCSWGHAG